MLWLHRVYLFSVKKIKGWSERNRSVESLKGVLCSNDSSKNIRQSRRQWDRHGTVRHILRKKVGEGKSWSVRGGADKKLKQKKKNQSELWVMELLEVFYRRKLRKKQKKVAETSAGADRGGGRSRGALSRATSEASVNGLATGLISKVLRFTTR